MEYNEIDVNAVCFGILCNFQQFCGEERAKEAAALVRQIYEENKKLLERAGLAEKAETLEKMVKEYQDVIVPRYREQAERAESRVRELETQHRTEMCEAGHDCVELGKVRREKEDVEEIASNLCDDFTDFVTGGVYNAAPYCANKRPECVNDRGWCNGDNRVCRGFLPNAARITEDLKSEVKPFQSIQAKRNGRCFAFETQGD